MEYGKKIDLQVQEVLEDLEKLPRDHYARIVAGQSVMPYAVWMTHYLNVQDRLRRLSRSIYASDGIDGAFLDNLTAELRLARDEMDTLKD